MRSLTKRTGSADLLRFSAVLVLLSVGAVAGMFIGAEKEGVMVTKNALASEGKGFLPLIDQEPHRQVATATFALG